MLVELILRAWCVEHGEGLRGEGISAELGAFGRLTLIGASAAGAVEEGGGRLVLIGFSGSV